MATPEKALADKVRNQRGYAIRSQRDMKAYLCLTTCALTKVCSTVSTQTNCAILSCVIALKNFGFCRHCSIDTGVQRSAVYAWKRSVRCWKSTIADGSRIMCRHSEKYCRKSPYSACGAANFLNGQLFYGGTSLRIVHGLDRFSEDMDFSLLRPEQNFNLGRYGDALQREMRAYGFDVWTETKIKRTPSAIQSAFLKANTLKQLLIIEAGEEIVRALPKGQQVKIKLEVDTDPPGGFETEIAYLLQPIPFSVRVYALARFVCGENARFCCAESGSKGSRDAIGMIWSGM